MHISEISHQDADRVHVIAQSGKYVLSDSRGKLHFEDREYTSKVLENDDLTEEQIQNISDLLKAGQMVVSRDKTRAWVNKGWVQISPIKKRLESYGYSLSGFSQPSVHSSLPYSKHKACIQKLSEVASRIAGLFSAFLQIGWIIEELVREHGDEELLSRSDSELKELIKIKASQFNTEELDDDDDDVDSNTRSSFSLVSLLNRTDSMTRGSTDVSLPTIAVPTSNTRKRIINLEREASITFYVAAVALNAIVVALFFVGLHFLNVPKAQLIGGMLGVIVGPSVGACIADSLTRKEGISDIAKGVGISVLLTGGLATALYFMGTSPGLIIGSGAAMFILPQGVLVAMEYNEKKMGIFTDGFLPVKNYEEVNDKVSFRVQTKRGLIEFYPREKELAKQLEGKRVKVREDWVSSGEFDRRMQFCGIYKVLDVDD